MGKKFSYFNTKNESFEDWKNICPVDEYRVIGQDQVPDIIPKGLVEKAESILVMASGTQNGSVIYMANINRVDEKAAAIDQEPFGIIFLSKDTTSSGCLIHHGDWIGRTSQPGDNFWNNVAASGIGNCYPLNAVPTNPSGSIYDLNIESQEGAFNNLCDKLRKYLRNNKT